LLNFPGCGGGSGGAGGGGVGLYILSNIAYKVCDDLHCHELDVVESIFIVIGCVYRPQN